MQKRRRINREKRQSGAETELIRTKFGGRKEISSGRAERGGKNEKIQTYNQHVEAESDALNRE